MEQPRNEKGKFILKGEEERKVRTVRLTDSVWNRLDKIARQRCITRTELIEELLMQHEVQSINNHNEVVIILQEALSLKANAGGAIKKKIKVVLSKLTAK